MANLEIWPLDLAIQLIAFFDRFDQIFLYAGEWFNEFKRWNLMPLLGDIRAHHHQIDYHPIRWVYHPPSCLLLPSDHSHSLFETLSSFWDESIYDHCQLVPNHPHQKISSNASFSPFSSSFLSSSSFSSYSLSINRSPFHHHH